ncbi:hypothetical protein [Streptomyces sp. NPDC050504]|uniref:hypothetical protein n=1 Tax=Streptomyces sp. NPDC050504 TaxID=3365618 RepID=UPI0037963192
MSTDETESTAPTTSDEAPARPNRVTGAAALAGLEGAALLVGGGYMLLMGLLGSPDKPEQAEMGGLTLIALAVIPLLAARGLLKLRSWSRGPALITQIMAMPVAWTLLRSGSDLLIPTGIVLAVTAVTALAFLLNAETTEALGIRARTPNA